MPAAIRVEYLFSRECPSHAEGLDRLHAAGRAAGVELDVQVIEIRTDAEAEARRFPGSPTYRVEGRDIAPGEDPPHHHADACRAYVMPGGRIGPLPHMDTLVAALAGARDRNGGQE